MKIFNKKLHNRGKQIIQAKNSKGSRKETEVYKQHNTNGFRKEVDLGFNRLEDFKWASEKPLKI